MLAAGHARQRRERFALRSGGDEHEPVAGQARRGVDVDDQPVGGDAEVSEVLGDLHVADHGPADERDPPVVPDGDVDDLLDAVDVAGERRDDDAVGCLADDPPVEDGADLPFGSDEARHLRIGGIDEEQVDAFVAEPGEPGQVGEPVVQGATGRA